MFTTYQLVQDFATIHCNYNWFPKMLVPPIVDIIYFKKDVLV